MVKLPIGMHIVMLKLPLVATYVVVTPENQYTEVELTHFIYVNTPYRIINSTRRYIEAA